MSNHIFYQVAMWYQARSYHENGDQVSWFPRRDVHHAEANPRGTVAQACINIAAALGAISGPLIIGALTKGDVTNGWRNYYVSWSLQNPVHNVDVVVVDSNGALGFDGRGHIFRL